ncbi:MAG TPA: 2-hydroxyhepta-2,4-diene-1,7-dioate isomerase [Chitinophagaceae bacterium]|nr:2-hydroxyhepta-2,4-diene-1,7-dioate isomerase [Chitinophagaceae bacterium]
MKIFCIGRNYAAHIEELKNETPGAPVIFMKPPTALLMDNKPFYYPDFSKDIHYECELVLKVCKNGRNIYEKFASKYYDQITLGIDFTARDLQEHQKSKGLPWEIAKAFDHSAVIGPWQDIAETEKNLSYHFRLEKNEKIVQECDTSLMIYQANQIIHYISQFFTIQTGDIIFTGTPKGVGPIQIGDRYKAFLSNQEILNFEIK